MNQTTSKILILTLVLAAVSVSVAAQTGIPEKPHRVFGNITDGSSPVTSTDVSFHYSGSTLVTDTTDSRGYYDVQIPYSSDYDGENVELYVDGSATGQLVTFSSGASQQLDEDGDYIANTTSSEGSGGDGGDDEAANETTDDQTDTEEESPGDTPQEPEQQPETPAPVEVNVPVQGDEAEAKIGVVQPNQEVNVEFQPERDDQSVERVRFTSNAELKDVSVKVRNFGSNKPEETSPAGTEVYSYQEISLENVAEGQVSTGTVSFRVEKSWLAERGRDPGEVVLKRFVGEEWEEFSGSQTGETETHYRFEAEVPGFSFYAVALSDETVEGPVNRTDGGGTGGQDDDGSQPPRPVVTWVAVTVLVAVVLLLSYLRREALKERWDALREKVGAVVGT